MYGFGEAQHKQLKALCCTEPPPYTGCDWHTKGTQDPPPHPRPAHCSGKCPSGKVLIATDNMCFSGGTRALCCYPPNTYNDNYVTDFKNKLLSFTDDHTCPVSQILGPVHAKRSVHSDEPNTTVEVQKQTRRSNAKIGLGKEMQKPKSKIQARDFKSLGGFETLQILHIALPLGTRLSGFILEAFNEVVGSKTDLRVSHLKAAVADDPYDDPLFSLAWMLCEWDDGPRILLDQSDTKEICEIPTDDYDFSGVGSDTNDSPQQKRKRDLQVSGREVRSYNWLDGPGPNLSKRVFFQDNTDTTPVLSSMPSTGLLLQAIMDDNLPLLYIQRIRYRAHVPAQANQDTILEVAYDLRGRPDLQGVTPGDAGGPNREDRFAVFHFHTLGLYPDDVPGGPDYPHDQLLPRLPRPVRRTQPIPRRRPVGHREWQHAWRPYRCPRASGAHGSAQLWSGKRPAPHLVSGVYAGRTPGRRPPTAVRAVHETSGHLDGRELRDV